MPHRILVADDDPHIREVICYALERAGLETSTARNGAEAVASVRRATVDLIVLDVGMPEMDGLEACRQIRRSSEVPILFLSARGDEIDRVLGLEIGGDDYLTKPFSPRELVARVNSILRRASGSSVRTATALVHGELRLDRERHSILAGEAGIDLTGLEFAILEALLSRPGVVLSREQLIRAAYGPTTYVSDRTVDSHIRNIRAKLQQAGQENVIKTVHGVGFKV